MRYKFQIEGIDCSGCIAIVKKVLEEHMMIDKAIVLARPIGLTFIDMNIKLSAFELQNQLDDLEGYSIAELEY